MKKSSNKTAKTQFIHYHGARLRSQIVLRVNAANAEALPERRVPIKAAITVANRDLAFTTRLQPEARVFSALRAVNAHVALSIRNKQTTGALRNADLLPVGHPASTKPHAMTASALRRAHAQWLAADTAIDPAIRPLVASAFSALPGSAQRDHAFARLALSSAPIYVTADPLKLNPIIAVAGFGMGGNSSAARSARARMQRRDRYGRFAFMGGGFIFNVRMPDMSFRTVSGRVVGASGTDAIEVELTDTGVLPDGIYSLPSVKGETARAILSRPFLDKLPGVKSRATGSDKVFVDSSELARLDQPTGWTKVKTEGNLETYVSDDGYFALKQLGDAPAYELHRANLDNNSVGDLVKRGKSWADVQKAAKSDSNKYETVKRNAEKIEKSGQKAPPSAGDSGEPYDALLDGMFEDGWTQDAPGFKAEFKKRLYDEKPSYSEKKAEAWIQKQIKNPTFSSFDNPEWQKAVDFARQNPTDDLRKKIANSKSDMFTPKQYKALLKNVSKDPAYASFDGTPGILDEAGKADLVAWAGGLDGGTIDRPYFSTDSNQIISNGISLSVATNISNFVQAMSDGDYISTNTWYRMADAKRALDTPYGKTTSSVTPNGAGYISGEAKSPYVMQDFAGVDLPDYEPSMVSGAMDKADDALDAADDAPLGSKFREFMLSRAQTWSDLIGRVLDGTRAKPEDRTGHENLVADIEAVRNAKEVDVLPETKIYPPEGKDQKKEQLPPPSVAERQVLPPPTPGEQKQPLPPPTLPPAAEAPSAAKIDRDEVRWDATKGEYTDPSGDPLTQDQVESAGLDPSLRDAPAADIPELEKPAETAPTPEPEPAKPISWNGGTIRADKDGIAVGYGYSWGTADQIRDGSLTPPVLPLFIPLEGDTKSDENGEGYYFAENGKRYWGKYGGAGILPRTVGEDGVPRYMLGKRATWVSGGGGKWGFPGGAYKDRDSANDPVGTALEELSEELNMNLDYTPEVKGVHVNQVEPGWGYSTVIADIKPEDKDKYKIDGYETTDAGYFTADEILAMRDRGELHPAVADTIDDILKQAEAGAPEQVAPEVNAPEAAEPAAAALPTGSPRDITGKSPQDKIAQIEQAIADGTQVRFDYNGKERTFTPTGSWVNNQTGNTNVIGIDDSGEKRTFTVEKMVEKKTAPEIPEDASPLIGETVGNLRSQIEDAIGSKSPIRFDYNGKERVFTPERIYTNPNTGTTNVVGFSHGDGEDRTFIVDKIDALPVEVNDASVDDTMDKSAFDAAFDSIMDTPPGAYKVDIFREYQPQGRTNEKSADFTDDPVVLSSMFEVDELAQALKEAILPSSNGEPASGSGTLEFRDGPESVKAEALFEAINNQGHDGDLIVAAIYDSKLDPNREMTNVERINAEVTGMLDKPESNPFRNEIPVTNETLERLREPEIRQQPKMTPFAANVDRVTHEIMDFVETNDKYAEIGKVLQDLQDLTKEPTSWNIGRDLENTLEKLLPYALSKNSEENAAFAGFWGMLLSLDGGDSGIEEHLKTPWPRPGSEESTDQIFNAIFRHIGGDDTNVDENLVNEAKQLYDQIGADYGGFDHFNRERNDILNGYLPFERGDTVGHFFRLTKAAAKPNEVPLYRVVYVDNNDSDLLDLYTTEGSRFGFEPRSWGDRDLTDGSWDSQMIHAGRPGSRVVFEALPGELDSIEAKKFSWFPENEHFGYGDLEVVSVRKQPLAYGKTGDEYVVQVRRTPKQPSAQEVVETAVPEETPNAPSAQEQKAPSKIAYTGMENWKQFAAGTGSNQGGFFRDPQGNEYYVKVPRSQSHAEVEALAASFYEELGVNVAGTGLGDKNGELRIVSPLVPNADTSGFIDAMDVNDSKILDAVREDFVVDAWLGNYDVIGYVADGSTNIVLDKNGEPVRVDQGGTLIWSATGKPKGGLFARNANHLDIMRDPDTYPQAARVFEGATDEQLRIGAMKVRDIAPSRIDEMVDQMISDPEQAALIKDKLKSRRQDIIDRFNLPEGNEDPNLFPEPVPLTESMGFEAQDLQPGDITAGDSFVIEKVFRDESTPKGKVSVQGYYPGHESQRKEWNESTTIDAARGSTLPPKGDKPALHRPSAPKKPKQGGFTGQMEEMLTGVDNWQEAADVIRGTEMVFFDYETTGIRTADTPDELNRPVQLGAVRVRDGKVVERFNVYMNPEFRLSGWSRDNLFQGDGQPVTDEFLAQQMSMAEAHRQFIEFAGESPILGGQNVPFDLEVLQRTLSEQGLEMNIAGTIDSMDMAGSTLPKWTKANPDGPFIETSSGQIRASKSLGPVADYLNVGISGWHSADVDAEASWNIIDAMLTRAIDKPDTPTDLLDADGRFEARKLDKAEYDAALEQYKDDLAQYEMDKAVAAAWNCGTAGLTASIGSNGPCSTPDPDDLIKAATPQPDDGVDPDGLPSSLAGSQNIDHHSGDGVDVRDPYADEKFPPTEQQREIIDAVMTGEDTVVRALAGTGKTSTLQLIARRFKKEKPKDRIIYVAFNKGIQEEAAGKFPDNVEARTADSIAWAAVGKDITDKRKNNKSNVFPSEVAKRFGITSITINRGTDEEQTLTPRETVALVKKGINNFGISADDEISPRHFDLVDPPQELVDWANMMWDDLNDPKGWLPVTNTHVTKMWALSRPDLSKQGAGLKTPANTIFFDEAQDINPVIGKVIADQSIQKVYVGDGNQAIYAFRGAEDELQKVEATHDLPLTKSWRFGPQVAGIGNRFLSLLGSKYRIEGAGPDGEIVDRGSMDNADAVLVRSNAGAIKAIFDQLELGRTVGVSANYKNSLEDFSDTARWLMDGAFPAEKPKNISDELAQYRSWDEVLKDAKDGENRRLKLFVDLIDEIGIDGLNDMLSRVKVHKGGEDGKAKPVDLVDAVDMSSGMSGLVVDTPKGPLNYSVTGDTIALGGATFDVKDQIKAAGFAWNKDNKTWVRSVSSPEGRADAVNKLKKSLSGGDEGIDVVVTTAHRSKGLEWDNVKIYDDFWGPRIDKNTGETIMPSPEEMRLAYVAVTRAKKRLDPGALDWVYGYTSNDDELPNVPGKNVPEGFAPPTGEPVDFMAPPTGPAVDLPPPGAPEAPNAPEVPETPQAPEAPEVPEVSEAPNAPEVVETPQAPEAPAAIDPAVRKAELDKYELVDNGDGEWDAKGNESSYLREDYYGNWDVTVDNVNVGNKKTLEEAQAFYNEKVAEAVDAKLNAELQSTEERNAATPEVPHEEVSAGETGTPETPDGVEPTGSLPPVNTPEFDEQMSEIVADLNDTLDALKGMPSQTKQFKDLLNEALDIADRYTKGDITFEEAASELQDLSAKLDGLPEKGPNTIFTRASITNLHRLFADRPIGKGLPPDGSGLGYSKEGIFITPGMRVRDKWGFAGTVIRYNEADYINVYIIQDVDPRDPDKVKKGKWGPKANTTSKNTKTLTVIKEGDDNSPWLDTGKVPESKKPKNLEEQLRLLEEMNGRDDGEGPVGVVEPGPAPDSGGGGEAGEPEAGTTEALRENVEEQKKEEAWAGGEEERKPAPSNGIQQVPATDAEPGPLKPSPNDGKYGFSVGDTLTYRATGGDLRTGTVVEIQDDVKNGEPGFVIRNSDGTEFWGYNDQIESIKKAEEKPKPAFAPPSGAPVNTPEMTTKLGTHVATPDLTQEGSNAAPDHTPRDKELLEKMIAEGPNAVGSEFTANWVNHLAEFRDSGVVDQEATNAIEMIEMLGDSDALYAASEEFALLQNLRAGIAIFTEAGPQEAMKETSTFKRTPKDKPITGVEDYVYMTMIGKGKLTPESFYTDLARYYDDPSLIDKEMTPASAFLRAMRSAGVKENTSYARWVKFDVPLNDESHPLHQLSYVGQEFDLRPSSWTFENNLGNVVREFDNGAFQGSPSDYAKSQLLDTGDVVLVVDGVQAFNISGTSALPYEVESVVSNGKYRVVSVEPYMMPLSVDEEYGEITEFLPTTRIRLESIDKPPATETPEPVAPEPVEAPEVDPNVLPIGDFSSSHIEGSGSLQEAMSKTSGTPQAIMASLVDGDDIEDLVVKVSVLERFGSKSDDLGGQELRHVMTLKLTEATGFKLYNKARGKKDGWKQHKEGSGIEYRTFDPVSGTFSSDPSKMSWSDYVYGANTEAFEYLDPDKRFRIVAMPRDFSQLHGQKPSVTANAVNIEFSETYPSDEAVQDALAVLGVKEPRQAAPADLHLAVGKKLIRSLSGVRNPTDAEYYLAQIKKDFGVAPEDFTVRTNSSGFIDVLGPQELADKIIEKTKLSGLTHDFSLHGVTAERKAEYLVNIILNGDNSPGALMSAAQRFQLGLIYEGLSTSDDLKSGAGDYVFLSQKGEMQSPHLIDEHLTYSGTATVIFDDHKVLRRVDTWANSDDLFGATAAHDDYLANIGTGYYEFMLKNHASLLDATAIVVSEDQRTVVLDLLRQRNVSEINGIPIEDFIGIAGRGPVTERGRFEKAELEKFGERLVEDAPNARDFIESARDDRNGPLSNNYDLWGMDNLGGVTGVPKIALYNPKTGQIIAYKTTGNGTPLVFRIESFNSTEPRRLAILGLQEVQALDPDSPKWVKFGKYGHSGEELAGFDLAQDRLKTVDAIMYAVRGGQMSGEDVYDALLVMLRLDLPDDVRTMIVNYLYGSSGGLKKFGPAYR